MKHIDNLENLTGSWSVWNILDVGSGHGKFLFGCAERNYRATGLELDENKITHTLALAKEKGVGLSIFQGEAENLPFPNESFDFLNISEVIEHVSSPAAVLAEAWRVLVPGGYAYVSVPNRFGYYDSHFHLIAINWLPRAWADKIIYWLGRDKDYSHKVDKQRLSEMHYFTCNQFTQLAKQIGFTVSDIREKRLKEKFGNWSFFVFFFYRLARFFAFDSFHFLLQKRQMVKT